MRTSSWQHFYFDVDVRDETSSKASSEKLKLPFSLFRELQLSMSAFFFSLCSKTEPTPFVLTFGDWCFARRCWCRKASWMTFLDGCSSRLRSTHRYGTEVGSQIQRRCFLFFFIFIFRTCVYWFHICTCRNFVYIYISIHKSGWLSTTFLASFFIGILSHYFCCIASYA